MDNSEQMWKAARHAGEAADRMQQAAGSAEDSARRIAHLLEDGYGGRGIQLIEQLENARGGYHQALADVRACIELSVRRGEHSEAEAAAGINAVEALMRESSPFGPERYVSEYLERGANGEVTLVRRPLNDYPAWAEEFLRYMGMLS